jgi:glycosyltransferase involved in cell wall biosynthesis
VSPRTPTGTSLLFVATIATTIRQFLSPYAIYFRARGWRVDAAANGAGMDPELRAVFDHAYELPLSRSIADPEAIIRSTRAIARLVGETRPDIVHVHTPIASFVTRLALRSIPRARRPAVAYTAHGFHFHDHGHFATNTLFLAAERIAGRWTDRLVVINDEDEEAARRHRIVPRSNLVRMAGIGLDTKWFSPHSIQPAAAAAARARLGIRPTAPLFAVVGELNGNKRPADSIDALASMRRSDAQLVLLGDGPVRAALEKLVGRRRLTGRVLFPGWVRDVRPVIVGATALATTSKREGLSRSVMEALALSVPVVASTARGNRELVGDSGFIVEIGDVHGLADAMDWLIEHPEERQAMGRRGRQRVVERYDLQHLIRVHEALYVDMLAERT